MRKKNKQQIKELVSKFIPNNKKVYVCEMIEPATIYIQKDSFREKLTYNTFIIRTAFDVKPNNLSCTLEYVDKIEFKGQAIPIFNTVDDNQDYLADRVFHSFDEFEREMMPKSYAKRMRETRNAIQIAKDSIVSVKICKSNTDMNSVVTNKKITCYFCGAELPELTGSPPCGPCPEQWKCPSCDYDVSPCCGAEIIHKNCGCEICQYCGDEVCLECGEHCHCGGCV